ncbi:MAG: VCBS repeat-containing protein, partial [Planctomycetes bacterium]|nr:VCBS repeat-containing protein [Planctomycetota bacterium]
MKVQIDRLHMRLLCNVITSMLFVLATSASRADITFAEPEFYAECTPSHYPTRARLFDMDGDGKKDLLLPGRDILNILNWCTLNADGSAGPMQTVAVDGQVDDAVAADIDGDGADELTLVIRSYAGRLQVMRRAASGLMVSSAIIQLDREPRSIAKGDFDGDGDIDFAVSCYGSEHISILLNGGTGNFTVAQRIRVDAWSGGIPGPQDVMAGDLNADG